MAGVKKVGDEILFVFMELSKQLLNFSRYLGVILMVQLKNYIIFYDTDEGLSLFYHHFI